MPHLSLLALRLGTALVIAASLAPAASAAQMNVSGTFTGSCTMQDPHPLDRPDHVVVAQICKATNAGPGTPFDGATVAFSQIVVLDRGNGPQTGENAIVDKSGSITSTYSGVIKTILVDGQPRTTGAGTYHMVGGTGAYAGGAGHGTYDLTFTSPTDFVSHWNGVMQGPAAASR